MPKLIEFSNNRFTSTEGSIINLVIKAQGPDLSYRWERRGGLQLCSEANCRLNTSGWGAGEHTIFAIVYNNAGEAFVPYQIKLLPRSFDLAPIEINPELEKSTKKVRYFAYEQQSIRALKGEAYIFGLSEVSVVNSRRQLLHWNKRLVLPLSSLVLFGKEKAQEFLVNGGSRVGLFNRGKNKILVLEKGALRSRQFQDTSSHTIIKVGDKIQLQAAIPSDYLIRVSNQKNENNKLLDLVVLKGSVEISYFQDEQNQGQGEKLVFKQLVDEGSILTGLSNARDSFRVSLIVPEDFEEIFYNTTPYYSVNFEDPLTKNTEEFGSIDTQSPKNIKDAIERAKSFLKEHDFFGVLEQLLPFNEQIYENYWLAYLLGRASKELFLFEQAQLALEIALEIDEDRDEAKYALAHLNLLQENWQLAEDFYNQTNAEDSENPKLWNYYRGFVNYKLESSSSSSWFFTRSLWEKPNQEIDASINSFLETINQAKNFDGLLELFYLRDSNPLKVESGTKNSAGIGAGWYDGFSGFLSFGYKIFHDGFNSSSFNLANTFLGHADLNPSSNLDLTLSIPTVFSVIESTRERREPLLYLGLEPLIGGQMTASSRAYDKVGMKWKIGSFGLGLDLNVSFFDIMYLDPEPEILKPIDPISFEDNDNLDIGFRQRGFILNGSKAIGNISANFSLSLINYLYRYEGSFNKSFSSYSISVDGTYSLSLRWKLAASFGYETRDFLSEEANRSDKLMDFGTSLIWAWLPTLDLILAIVSESKDSNVDQLSFQRWLYKTGLTYRF